MDLNSYIYEFLHDPRKNRWAQPVVDYLLQLAKNDITSKVNVFLKTRDINRELAQLKQLGTEDKTVGLNLQNGQSVYDLPEDFLRVSSVLYEGCFIPHLIPDCGDTAECDECGDIDPHSVIRSYNTSGLPKGKIKLSPTPKNIFKTSTPATTYKRVEVLNEESILGWGFLNILPKRDITEVEEECVEEETKIQNLQFGKLEVTYESSNELKFDDNDDEVLKALLDDDQLKKFFVCGHLLRDDKDSNSRSLGAEELQLYEQRIVTLLGKYAELYDKDNVLEISSAGEGYVDNKMNESILLKDLVSSEASKLEEARVKAEARKGKAKFDTLGVR
jgi:hypothetical protein